MERMNLTKKEIVAFVAENAGLTKKDADKAVTATFAAIAQGVCEAKLVRMSGVGTLGTVWKEERTGHNPQTGAPMVIPAHKAVKFRVSKDIKANL